MLKNLQKVLFFINGVKPSDKEMAEATEIAANVVIRNGLMYVAKVGEGTIEKCDAVGGSCVPERYASTYPLYQELLGSKKVKKQKSVSNLKSATPVKPVQENEIGTLASGDKPVWKANA